MTKKKVGFAIMDPELQKRIASIGGKAAHAYGRAHEFDTETAILAGRKGGAASAISKRKKRNDQK
jgi:uncharacterized protein